MPFFSIIIPVYNVAPYLRECLDSVLAQTFTDWEAICVDDGSTDGSGAILDEYAAKDSRFRVFHQPNAGVSAARNKALDAARGAWIGFLDADDVLSKDWLETVSTGIDGSEDWIRTKCTGWDGRDSFYEFNELKCERNEFWDCRDGVLSVGWHLISRCGFPFVNYYRRDIIGNVRFPPGIRFREDALFCYEAALKVRKLRILPTAGYFRREHDGSASAVARHRDDTIKLLAEYERIWEGGVAKLDKGLRLGAMLEASTFWVMKDVCEWIVLCVDMRMVDAWKVARILRRFRSAGIISKTVPGTRFENMRWRLFMATGWCRVLRITRKNLLGRKVS